MLSKALVVKIKRKLILTNMTRKQLALQLNSSYIHLVNVLNRKVSSERLELLLKEWSEK
jgi:hypothetical protein